MANAVHLADGEIQKGSPPCSFHTYLQEEIMSTETVRPVVVRPIPNQPVPEPAPIAVTEPVAVTVKAAEAFECVFPGCKAGSLTAETAFVPGLVWLYFVVRKTDVDKSRPLTRGEILAHVRCEFHGRNSAVGHDYNKRLGIDAMFSVSYTLNILNTWTAEIEKAKKIQRMKVFSERLYGRGLPPKKTGFIGFVEPLAKPFVAETFEKLGKPAEDKPNPKHRKPRVLHAPVVKEAKEKKGKKGGDQKKGKGKSKAKK